MSQKKYLFIGGSTKCGTTSVFNYFEFHPEICPCVMKESRYFWTKEYPLDATCREEKRTFPLMTYLGIVLTIEFELKQLPIIYTHLLQQKNKIRDL
ncbi:MAG: hypothetical protein IPP71_01235 [Bacteroidetes bacterium]|nr:hypothetical protein [Bacteroidota bacterium]